MSESGSSDALTRDNIAIILAGHDFAGDLLRLISRADRTQRERLRLAYPLCVAAIERFEERSKLVQTEGSISNADSRTTEAASEQSRKL